MTNKTLYTYKVSYIIPNFGDSYSYFSTLAQVEEWINLMESLPIYLQPLDPQLEKVKSFNFIGIGY